VIVNIQKHSGFTLLELLIAMAVFGVVSYMAYTGLAQILDARDRINISQKRLAAIQLTFLKIERDIQNIVKRPIRDQFGGYIGEVVGDELDINRLEITRGARNVPDNISTSNLQRVGYRLEDEILYRVSWPVLDPAQDTEPRVTKILTGVEELELRFLSQKGEWQNSWDSAATPVGQGPNASAIGIPRAVGVKITIKDYGEINRLFLMPEA